MAERLLYMNLIRTQKLLGSGFEKGMRKGVHKTRICARVNCAPATDAIPALLSGIKQRGRKGRVEGDCTIPLEFLYLGGTKGRHYCGGDRRRIAERQEAGAASEAAPTSTVIPYPLTLRIPTCGGDNLI